MTVYVCQDDGRKRLDPVDAFGTPEVLFGRSLFPDEAEFRLPVMTNIARAKLARFDPERDFLLVNGDPAGIALAVSVLTLTPQVRAHGFFKVLKYDKMYRGYYAVIIHTGE